jgi:16S rRNA processing protein RimM
MAHLLRPQGRKGELLADLFTDIPEHFQQHPQVFLAVPGFAGAAADARAAELTGFWLPTGKNLGRIVLAFAGTESISQAELLAGLDVLIPSSERLDLEPGAEYVDNLVGCQVFDGPNLVGTLDSIDFPAAADGRKLPGAAPLLTVVTSEGDEVLIPYAQNFVVSVDTAARRIEMTLPPGLLELNRPKP